MKTVVCLHAPIYNLSLVYDRGYARFRGNIGYHYYVGHKRIPIDVIYINLRPC